MVVCISFEKWARWGSEPFVWRKPCVTVYGPHQLELRPIVDAQCLSDVDLQHAAERARIRVGRRALASAESDVLCEPLNRALTQRVQRLARAPRLREVPGRV